MLEAGCYFRGIMSQQDRYHINKAMLPPTLRHDVLPPGLQAYGALWTFVQALPEVAVPRYILAAMKPGLHAHSCATAPAHRTFPQRCHCSNLCLMHRLTTHPSETMPLRNGHYLPLQSLLQL